MIKKIATVITLCIVAVLAMGPLACCSSSQMVTYDPIYDKEEESGGPSNIHRMKSDGTGQTNLTQSEDYNGQPQPSPDGSKIAYVSTATDKREIHVMDADGSNSTKVTTSPEGVIPSNPQWAPNSGSLAYSWYLWSGGTSSNGINTVKPDGTGQTEVVGGSDFYYEPQWSPNGQWISYVKDGESTSGIYKVKPDGTGETPIVTGDYYYHGYHWSPDGQWVTFSGMPEDSDVFQIYKVPSGGGTPTNLTDDENSNRNPQWSPATNAGWIVYHADTPEGTPQIYKIKSDGTGKMALTDTEHYQEWPVWHPGGEWVYYVRTEEPASGPWTSDIWRVMPDGTGATNITNDPASWYSSPTWLPVQ